MRRRSERKKSTDVSSPAVARRSGRRRKSPSSEKNAEEYTEVAEEASASESQNRASSEEPLAEKSSRRSRNIRRRTPVSELSTPSKRKSRRSESPDVSKIDAIPEEENGAVENTSKKHIKEIQDDNCSHRDGGDDDKDENKERQPRKTSESVNEVKDEPTIGEEGSGTRKMEVTAEQINEDVSEKEVIGNSRSLSPKAMVEEKSKTSDVLDIKEDSQEVGQYEDDDVVMRSFASITNEKSICNNEESVNERNDGIGAGKIRTDIATEATRNTGDNENIKQQTAKLEHEEHADLDSNENSVVQINTNSVEAEKSLNANGNQAAKKPQEEVVRVRKRKWLTKKSESKAPILAISTDSLKGLISDVHPVPLSDVRLDSSPDVEEIISEREEGEETPTPERREERQRDSVEKILEKPAAKRALKEPIITVPVAATAAVTAAVATVVPNASVHLQRSPSPPRNKTSHVLYITNLVRPFTVLQLKGLLARTGKIVEDGFWIDRIKSKCYVQYETEDEAVETRHALHGVRWPISNPKCLNVDFGNKADMERAIESTKEDAPKLGQDNKDNVIIGTGWSRGERNEDIDRKTVRPVREWDVGKKENLDREKNRDVDKRRSRERERERERDRGRNRDRERERDISGNRENEKSNDRKARNRGRDRSHSMSPARHIKKENEPPLRLLDDLFRKTKATPCVYWLPLTPEQIAEKEAFRQKRIQEHQERIKQRELERETEREKEREKERNRGNERDRDRDRRNRSSDRRRSRSRDRRRY